MDKHEEDGVCSAESIDGSLDVWSCKNSDSSSAHHLVVMVHGILGSTDDWKFGAEQFVKRLPDKVFNHCLVIHWIFKRSGRHLFLKDEEEGKPPLLRRMVEDTDDCHFISALRSFKRRVVYSNVSHDHVVGWRTASIRRDSELPKWEDSLNEKYPHIVYEELCKACDAKDIPEGENHSNNIEEEMIKGLSSVSWEKVDVSFHSSRQRFAAHSVIQVKNEIMHIEGADVIEHIIDHFHA